MDEIYSTFVLRLWGSCVALGYGVVPFTAPRTSGDAITLLRVRPLLSCAGVRVARPSVPRVSTVMHWLRLRGGHLQQQQATESPRTSRADARGRRAKSAAAACRDCVWDDISASGAEGQTITEASCDAVTSALLTMMDQGRCSRAPMMP